MMIVILGIGFIAWATWEVVIKEFYK